MDGIYAHATRQQTLTFVCGYCCKVARSEVAVCFQKDSLGGCIIVSDDQAKVEGLWR